MEQLFTLVDHYAVEIVTVAVTSILLVYLIRSFKRNLLIGHGQTRLVLEKYDHHSGIVHYIISVVVLLLLIPLLVYAKCFNS